METRVPEVGIDLAENIVGKRQDTERKYTKIQIHILHKISRVLFPVMFIIFNIMYWGYYLYMKKFTTNDFYR